MNSNSHYVLVHNKTRSEFRTVGGEPAPCYVAEVRPEGTYSGEPHQFGSVDALSEFLADCRQAGMRIDDRRRIQIPKFSDLVAEVSAAIDCRRTVQTRLTDISWHLDVYDRDGLNPEEPSHTVNLVQNSLGSPYWSVSAYVVGGGVVTHILDRECYTRSQAIDTVVEAWQRLKAEKVKNG